MDDLANTVDTTDIITRPGEFIHIVERDVRGVRCYHTRRWWWPFTPVVNFLIISQANLADFKSHLTDGYFKACLDQFRRNLIAGYRTKLLSVGKGGLSKACQLIKERFTTNTRNRLATARITQIKEPITAAEELINQVTNDATNKLRQEIGAQIATAVVKVLHTAVKRIGDAFKDRAGGGLRLNTSTAGEILPNGCRCVAVKGSSTAIVIELEPQVRTIFLKSDLAASDNQGREQCRVAFPYLIFVALYQGGIVDRYHLFYRNKPLRSLDDALCRPNLPNTDTGGTLCLRFPGHQQAQMLSLRVEEVIEWFWTSVFNYDWYDDNYAPSTRVDSRISSFATWEQSTKTDPTFALKVPWIPTDQTLRNLLTLWLKESVNTLSVDDIDLAVNQVIDECRPTIQLAITKACTDAVVRVKVAELTKKELTHQLSKLADAVVAIVTEEIDKLALPADAAVQTEIVTAACEAFDAMLQQEFDVLSRSAIDDRPLMVSDVNAAQEAVVVTRH